MIQLSTAQSSSLLLIPGVAEFYVNQAQEKIDTELPFSGNYMGIPGLEVPKDPLAEIVGRPLYDNLNRAKAIKSDRNLIYAQIFSGAVATLIALFYPYTHNGVLEKIAAVSTLALLPLSFYNLYRKKPRIELNIEDIPTDRKNYQKDKDRWKNNHAAIVFLFPGIVEKFKELAIQDKNEKRIQLADDLKYYRRMIWISFPIGLFVWTVYAMDKFTDRVFFTALNLSPTPI